MFLNAPGNCPDEPAHMAYVRYMAKTGRLPVFEKSPYWPRYTAFHPPFYYWILRQAYRPVANAPVDRQYQLLRFVSMLLHGLALWWVFLTGRRCFPGDEWAANGVLACAAFNPMFACTGASVSNDVMADVTMAGLVYFGLAFLQDGASRAKAAGWGLLSAAGACSKASVAGPAAAVWLYLTARRRFKPVEALLAAGFALLAAGPVLWRNWRLYGDPLALAAIYKTEPVAAGFRGLHRWFISSFESYWGILGWFYVHTPDGLMRALYWICSFAGLGLLGALRKKKTLEPRTFEFVAGMAVVFLLEGMFYGITSMQAHGRYLFIGLAAFMPLMFLGLRFWVNALPARWRPAVWTAGFAFGLALQWATLTKLVNTYYDLNFYVIPGVYNPKGL